MAVGREKCNRPDMWQISQCVFFKTQATADVESREAVDPAVYEGWDFDRLNREARELRRVARVEGYDAAVSSSRGRAAAVAPRRSA
jgi:hypothetical protein